MNIPLNDVEISSAPDPRQESRVLVSLTQPQALLLQKLIGDEKNRTNAAIALSTSDALAEHLSIRVKALQHISRAIENRE